MKKNIRIQISIFIAIATLLLPFQVTADHGIHLGYPFHYFTIFKNAIYSAYEGWHISMLQFININLIILLVDVAIIYFLITVLEKLRSKILPK